MTVISPMTIDSLLLSSVDLQNNLFAVLVDMERNAKVQFKNDSYPNCPFET